MNREFLLTLPDEPSFGPWVAWAHRLSLRGISAPGVYVLTHSHGHPPSSSNPISHPVIYVGETSNQTLADRWRQFSRSATTGKRSHSGGRTYFVRFGPERIDELYVCALPVEERSFKGIAAYIKYIERKLIWKHLARHGALPECNKE